MSDSPVEITVGSEPVEIVADSPPVCQHPHVIASFATHRDQHGAGGEIQLTNARCSNPACNAPVQFLGERQRNIGRIKFLVGATAADSAAPEVASTTTAKSPKKTGTKGKEKQPDRFKEIFDQTVADWGGELPITEVLFRHVATIQPNLDTLELGNGLATLAMQRGQPGKAVRYVLSDDEDTADKVRVLLDARPVEFRPAAGHIPFGQLFNGIFVRRQLTAEWIDRIPRLLHPGGHVYVEHPDQLRIVDQLAAALEYDVRRPGVDYAQLVPQSIPLGEGPGTVMVMDLAKSKMPRCQHCENVARRMNAHYAEHGTLEPILEELVESILPNARNWFENTDWRRKTGDWWKSNTTLIQSLVLAVKAKSEDTDAMLRESIRQRVRWAVQEWEKSGTSATITPVTPASPPA
jgi:hypothetical protein